MNVFGTELEATVRILRYDPTDNFVYAELESVPHIAENRVCFSILINIKQKGPIDNGFINIYFTHGYKKSGSSQPKQRSIHIGDLDLSTGTNSDTMYTRDRLSRDLWSIRKTFRINLASVPTEGPDDYALVLRVPPDSDSQKYRILDCAYLKVTEFEPHTNDFGR